MDRETWWAAVHGVAKSRTQLSDFTFTFHLSLPCIGGDGNPLQCSCLENPRDSRAWWAAVSGVAQSRTRLKRLSSSSSRASQVVLVVKNLPANVGDFGSIPESARSPGGRHGNPFHYSCLENPMDRGAWRATVHRVTKSWTWMKRLSMCAMTSIALHMWLGLNLV